MSREEEEEEDFGSEEETTSGKAGLLVPDGDGGVAEDSGETQAEEEEEKPEGKSTSQDEQLIEDARSLGMSAEDLKDIPPAAVRLMVRTTMNRMVDLSQRFPPAKQEEKTEEAPKGLVDLSKYDLSDAPESFVKVLNDINNEVARREAERSKSFSEENEVREQVALSRQLDEAITELGAEYEGPLGKGEVSESSAAFRNRGEVFVKARAMQQAYANSGMRAPSWPSLVKTVARALFFDPKAARAAARSEVEKEVKRNGKQVIGRPGTSQPTPKSKDPRARAKEQMNKVRREKGLAIE